MQLPWILQLPVGLLQWCLYMITTDAFAKTLGMPLATTQDWALGCLLCFLLPSVYLYTREKKLYHQYLQQCAMLVGDAGSSISSRMQHATNREGAADVGFCKRESATAAAGTSSSDSSRSRQGASATQHLGSEGNTSLVQPYESVRSFEAHPLAAPPNRTPAGAAAAPRGVSESSSGPYVSALTGAAAEVEVTAAPRRASVVPVYRSPLVYRTISVKVCSAGSGLDCWYLSCVILHREQTKGL